MLAQEAAPKYLIIVGQGIALNHHRSSVAAQFGAGDKIYVAFSSWNIWYFKKEDSVIYFPPYSPHDWCCLCAVGRWDVDHFN